MYLFGFIYLFVERTELVCSGISAELFIASHSIEPVLNGLDLCCQFLRQCCDLRGRHGKIRALDTINSRWQTKMLYWTGLMGPLNYWGGVMASITESKYLALWW